jgi:predicted DNA-binding ribbon-helix-helix protein
MHGKRVQFDDETWLALDVLARDRMMTFQELADEAFSDLLEKHHRPTDLTSALKQSAAMDTVRESAGRRRLAKHERKQDRPDDGGQHGEPEEEENG